MKSMTRVEVQLLKDEMVSVKFDYDAELVAQVRLLGGRRWNPSRRQWEVPIAHLKDLADIFSLQLEDLPAAIVKTFKKKWTQKRLGVRLGVLETQIHGASIPVVEIDAETSYFLPGYRFSPRFKSGRWDGKRHLFKPKTMVFPTGLWPRVRAVLERNGIEFKVEEAQEEAPSTVTAKFGSTKTQLRPYQEEILERAVSEGRGVIQLATGGGKTLIAAHLIRRFGRTTFFFVHTKDLLHQAADVFERELGTPIGRLGDGCVQVEDVTVATLQTAARALGMRAARVRSEDGEERSARERSTRLGTRKEEIARAIEAAGLVIFDECHHVPADTAYKIASRTPRARARFGLSATPWREDECDLLLEAALGEKLCAVTCSDLIEKGFLVAPKIVMELARSPRFVGSRPSYSEIYQTAIVENQSRNRAIATQARHRAARGLSTLILVKQIEHGKRLLELVPEAMFAYGQLETKVRQEYLENLEQKLRLIMIATTLADEGLDIPSLDGVILAGGGKSAIKAYQRIGRALRPYQGKSEAWIMDFFDRVPYLEDHSAARLNLYRQEAAFRIETRGFEP